MKLRALTDAAKFLSRLRDPYEFLRSHQPDDGTGAAPRAPWECPRCGTINAPANAHCRCAPAPRDGAERPHVTDGRECWCCPTIEEQPDGSALIIHRRPS